MENIYLVIENAQFEIVSLKYKVDTLKLKETFVNAYFR